MEGQGKSKAERGMAKEDDQREELQRVTRAEEEGWLETNLEDILANQLICKKIASYLSLADMKAASEVSRQFLQAIRGTQRFAQVAVLAITDTNPQDFKSTLQKTVFPWRGVKVDVTDPTDILEDLPRVLKSAEFVCLGKSPWNIRNYHVRDPIVVSLLTTVLSSSDSAPQLSHFQIDFNLLITDLRSVLSSPAAQETLRKLNRLDIQDTHPEKSVFPFFVEQEEEMPFSTNFRLLTGLPNRLKSFILSELLSDFHIDMNSINRSILNLLNTHRTTMEQLSVHGRVWELQELGTLKFPVLKTLSANVHKEKEEETLAKLLENQRSLEELTVESTVFHECLLTSIRGRCLELRKLDLTTETFSGDVDEWSFLGSMNRLKEFRFKIREKAEVEEDGVTNGWRLLAFLPKNQLDSLSLEGISTENSGFWSVEGGVELEFGVKAELLQGFGCLRRLSFLGSRDAVDDQLMQWLLTEFVSLEELEISDCGDLSNAGLSGDTRAEWGRNASLSDLRGLKSLKIVNCTEVTPKGVALCVRLPFLKSLDYLPPYKVRDSVVLELAGRNPSLERLIVNFKKGHLANLKAKVWEKNPRVELAVI